MRAIEPIAITGIDGAEYQLLLSMGGIKRLKKRYGVAGLADIWKQEAEGAIVSILFEAIIARPESLTEDAFADNLRCNMQELLEAVGKLMGVSMPDGRPITAGDLTTIQ